MISVLFAQGHSPTLWEAAGWTPVTHAYITMRNGRFPQNAWRLGYLDVGLGFEGSAGDHEITITYQPER